MDVKEFRKYISSKMTNIPPFIDTTSSIHYLIWGYLCEINLLLLKLVTPSVMNEKYVFTVVKYINEIFDEMDEIITQELQSKVVVYFCNMRMLIEEWSLEYELYETAANIKKFNDIYLQNNPII